MVLPSAKERVRNVYKVRMIDKPAVTVGASASAASAFDTAASSAGTEVAAEVAAAVAGA